MWGWDLNRILVQDSGDSVHDFVCMGVGVEGVGPGLQGAYTGTFASPFLSLSLSMDLYAEKVCDRVTENESCLGSLN